MNGLRAELPQIEAIRDAVRDGDTGDVEVLVCPPFTLVRDACLIADGTSLAVGGQNCHRAERGAHTGDISAAMLRDAGATYVILGHSERRADHGETNVAVRRKAVAAMAAGLDVIVCVGETQQDRDENRAMFVVERQISGSLPTDIDAARLVLAYEPIWAIGTGVTPTADDIREMHAFMRKEAAHVLPRGGQEIRLLYGGSVKPSNARDLMAVENVDGALVGGASLKAEDFLAIVAACRARVAA